MTPQSDLLGALSPSSINPTNRLVKIKPTLQVTDEAFPNIYSAGDVADLDVVKTGGAAWGQADLCMRNICKMIANPKINSSALGTYTPMAPQIFLYFGMARGVVQLKLFGILFVTSWNFLVKRFLSYNILASRGWDWLGTPLSKDTADL